MDDLAAYGTSGSSSSSSSDDDNDTEGARAPPAKRRRRLSTGLVAQELGRSAVSAEFRAREDPSRNDGRVRQFGHVPGNWATFVCIPVEPCEALERWVAAVVECADVHCARHDTAAASPRWRRVAGPAGGGGGGRAQSHISLSRTFPLKFPEIEPFRETLAIGVHAYNRSTAAEGGGCFSLALRQLKLFTNEDRSRSFLSLCPDATNGGLVRLVRLIRDAVDPACIAADAPVFYEPAEPHLSVAWTLGDVTGLVAVAQLQAEVEAQLKRQPISSARGRDVEASPAGLHDREDEEELIRGVKLRIDHVQSKSGNLEKKFPLR